MSTVDAATITKRAPALVAPSAPTPRGALALSALDHRLIGMRLSIDLVLVFPRGGGGDGDPARAVREGLARALVPYYPVAGRLAEPRPGELEVECTGEGVWFVEAAAACALEDVSHLGGAPLPVPSADLVARPPPGVNKDDLLFMMQVTEFKCGGVAVGITYNHLVFDGLGAAQFVNAAAELARGLAAPSVSPTWRRDSIPGPPPPAKPTSRSAPDLTFYRFASSEFDFPLESIDRVKGRVRSESGLGCTAFEAVTAMTWRSRTRAVLLPSEPYADADADVRLSFMANVRPVLCDRLGIRGGYYGNCVCPVGISAPGERVAGESLTALVGLIREAKRTVAAEFTAWLSGVDAGTGRFDVPLNYGTLMVTEWSRLGYGDVDYGWGGPGYVFPVQGQLSVLGTCVYVRPPVPKQGVRLVMRCVEERHVAALRSELEKLV